MTDEALSPDRIIGALEEETTDGPARMRRLERRATVANTVVALRTASTPFTRMLLCDLLGNKRARSAIPALIEALDDTDRRVRASAADALGKAFGYVDRPAPRARVDEALRALRTRWELEDDDDVRSTLTQTLALVSDSPAVVPLLRAALVHREEKVRRQAQWGLDYLAGKGQC
ncbi:MAG: HEAT repeat domain-containing protein [Streptosporangiaceae bacterium]